MPLAVHLLFIEGGKILLLRRANTGYRDGQYSMVAGHHEQGETLRQTAIREAKEEADVTIAPEDLTFKVLAHKREESERLAVFFLATKWTGEIKNMEPEKCDDLSWFPLDALPDNMVPYVRDAIEAYRSEQTYIEHGWD